MLHISATGRTYYWVINLFGLECLWRNTVLVEVLVLKIIFQMKNAHHFLITLPYEYFVFMILNLQKKWKYANQCLLTTSIVYDLVSSVLNNAQINVIFFFCNNHFFVMKRKHLNGWTHVLAYKYQNGGKWNLASQF